MSDIGKDTTTELHICRQHDGLTLLVMFFFVFGRGLFLFNGSCC